MKVIDLKALANEHGLRGYSKLRKAELITLLQNNPPPVPTLRPIPPAPTQHMPMAWAWPTRPPHPMRPPPPPPV